jgi:hypothetical protein
VKLLHWVLLFSLLQPPAKLTNIRPKAIKLRCPMIFLSTLNKHH